MMKKEDVMLLAQLLHAMKEVADKISHYHKKKDVKNLLAAKRELLNLQRRVNEIL